MVAASDFELVFLRMGVDGVSRVSVSDGFGYIYRCTLAAKKLDSTAVVVKAIWH